MPRCILCSLKAKTPFALLSKKHFLTIFEINFFYNFEHSDLLPLSDQVFKPARAMVFPSDGLYHEVVVTSSGAVPSILCFQKPHVPHRQAASPTSTGSKSHIDRQQVPHWQRRGCSPPRTTTKYLYTHPFSPPLISTFFKKTPHHLTQHPAKPDTQRV